MTFVQQDVLGLDVAMDDVVPMRVIERISHLDGDAERFVNGYRWAARKPIAQRLSRHDRHHEVQAAARFARVVEREDMRMIQAGGQLDLSKKALAAERFREIGTQDFDRDFPAVLVVVGQVDRGHTARSELAVESILMGERIGQDCRGLHSGFRPNTFTVMAPASAGVGTLLHRNALLTRRSDRRHQASILRSR